MELEARHRAAQASSERLEREEGEVKQERRLLDARAAGHEPDFLELDDWGEDKLGQNKEYMEDKFGKVSFRSKRDAGPQRQKTNDSGRLARLSFGRKSTASGAEGDHGAWQGPQRSLASEPHLGTSWGQNPSLPSSWSQAPSRGPTSNGQLDDEDQISPRTSTDSGTAASKHTPPHHARPHSSMRSRGSTKSSPTVKEVLGWLQNRFTKAPGRSGAPYSSSDSGKSGASEASNRKQSEGAQAKPAKPPALRLHEHSGSTPMSPVPPPALANRGSGSPHGAAVFGSPLSSPNLSSPRALQATPRSTQVPPTVHHLRLRTSVSCEQSGPACGPSAPSSPVHHSHSHASSPGARKSRGQLGSRHVSLDYGDCDARYPHSRSGRLGHAHASMDSGNSFTGKGQPSARSGRLGQAHASMESNGSFTGKGQPSAHRSGSLGQAHGNVESNGSFTSQGQASNPLSGRLGQAHASMDSGGSFTGKRQPSAHRPGRRGRSLEMPIPAPGQQPHVRKRLSVMSDRTGGSGNFAEALSDCLL